jgi:signal transduction histidine kinase
MVVQAAAARRVAATDPAAAAEAIAAVETAGRTALGEMRRMLEVLRTDEAGVGPQPGLGDLDRLVAQVREAGVPVALEMEGTPRTLPVGMDLAAYRIVQEALTNTVKHAGKANARVTVRYLPRELEIEAVDDGRGAAAPLLAGTPDGAGQGLVGMRERVALYGGEIETGAVFPGGYRVHVRLPYEPPEMGSAATRGEEESALSAVATAALRERLNRGSYAEPGQGLVKPRVVPPLIGRIVPPHPTPAKPRSRPTRRREP